MNMNQLQEISRLVPGLGTLLCARAALALRIAPRRDGWRRAAALVLRGECSTFVLSAFGLDLFSDTNQPANSGEELARDHATRRLLEFLKREPALHLAVIAGADEDRVSARNGPCCTLAFEPAPAGPARFIRPDSWPDGVSHPHAPAPGERPLMNIVCRLHPNGAADLWFRFNHAGIDGVPAQEALTRLENAWGVVENVTYPTAREFEAFTGPRPSPGREGLAEVQSFIDFAPVLAWRKRENSRLPEPLTFSAALLWILARHPALEGLHMGTTVEVGATGALERGVGVVVVRPDEYERTGLASYARDFNRRMERTRLRASAGCRTLDAAALIPATHAGSLLRHALDRDMTAFGSLGLTVLKDARVFGAPIAERGHADGFIAIGNLALPTGDGGKVGCITVKGPAQRISRYPALIAEAVARCAPPA